MAPPRFPSNTCSSVAENRQLKINEMYIPLTYPVRGVALPNHVVTKGRVPWTKVLYFKATAVKLYVFQRLLPCRMT